jgi:hypothetical protein
VTIYLYSWYSQFLSDRLLGNTESPAVRASKLALGNASFGATKGSASGRAAKAVDVDLVKQPSHNNHQVYIHGFRRSPRCGSFGCSERCIPQRNGTCFLASPKTVAIDKIRDAVAGPTPRIGAVRASKLALGNASFGATKGSASGSHGTVNFCLTDF